MKNLTIMRTVVVKQVVTENFKKKAASEIQEALQRNKKNYHRTNT